MVDILLVEDNKELSSLMSKFFVRDGYSVYCAKSGEEAIEFFNNEIAKLVILDIMLPKIDGFSVCSAIRKRGDVPIIIISAMVDKEDKMNGFNLGADDYIEKPFSPSVLIAKIKAMLAQYKRLTERDAMETNAIQSGEIRLDPKMMKVWVNEKEVHLKKKEFQLLEFLMRNRDIVFSKEELYSRVWGLDSYGDYATVAVHINRLREEIEDNPSDSKHIITVWGVGYKFV